MDALDQVTIEINYERPFFEFPNLDGEGGNPMVYWKEAINAIRKNGFKKEVEDIIAYDSTSIGGFYLPKIDYREQFNYLARFLDFTPKEETISEDEEFIYIKVKKESANISTKQPMLFNIKDIDTLKDLIDNEEDFSITNCYGRTILHYIDKPEVLKFFLEQNKIHQWIDLFHLDNFNSTILQTHDNIATFSLLLDAMYHQNPQLTSKFFTAVNSFGNNASGVYLRTLDHLFAKKDDHSINEEKWQEFARSVQIIKLVNPTMAAKFAEIIPQLPLFKMTTLTDYKSVQDNNLAKENLAKFNALFFYETLNSQTENDNIAKKKLKI